MADQRFRGNARSFLFVTQACVNHLRDPLTPGNQVGEEEETLASAYRRLSSGLARAWALCSSDERIQVLRPEIAFYEEVRAAHG